jgi:hypothetical protein
MKKEKEMLKDYKFDYSDLLVDLQIFGDLEVRFLDYLEKQ